jgi:hypothetical protein
MKKWADYLISEVNYDSEHLISVAIRHQDTDKGITVGIPVDRLTISSDIKNGLLYSTIYHGINTWKKGKNIQTFFIDGTPYLRIDGNKVSLDYLGDLPNSSIVIEEPTPELLPEPAVETAPSSKGPLPKESAEELPQELELLPEPAVETAPSSKGSLPKESAEELPQELELLPEPAVETQEEEVTPEQLSQVNNLEHQIDELEDMLSAQALPESDDEVTPEQLSQVNNLEHQIDELEDILFSQLDPTSEGTPEQLSKIKELEKEIEKLETVDLEHEIIQTLQNQNKKLDNIEKKLQNPSTKKSTTSDSLEAYCVKCKTKRKIKNPIATVMKNGRDAVKGSCSICDCNVFRIGKMKK